eukprot:4113157-Prymnesium_polylepis.2
MPLTPRQRCRIPPAAMSCPRQRCRDPWQQCHLRAAVVAGGRRRSSTSSGGGDDASGGAAAGRAVRAPSPGRRLPVPARVSAQFASVPMCTGTRRFGLRSTGRKSRRGAALRPGAVH